jgi:hypothetical protein
MPENIVFRNLKRKGNISSLFEDTKSLYGTVHNNNSSWIAEGLTPCLCLFAHSLWNCFLVSFSEDDMLAFLLRSPTMIFLVALESRSKYMCRRSDSRSF